MSSQVPDLDTTDFDDLVEAARSLIPRYAPEWTDHNLHDPGITIIDLLAWLVDQQVYRTGFVNDRLLEAFAALLGVVREDPTSAQGWLWPLGPEGAPSVPVAMVLAAGRSATCEDQPDVHFVVEREMWLTTARLDRVTRVADGDELDLPLLRPTERSVVIPRPSTGDAAHLVLGFDGPLVDRGEDGDAGPPPIALGFDVVTPPGPPPGDDQVGWFGPLAFDHRAGDGPWTPVEVVDDTTLGLTRSGGVLLRVPVTSSGEPSTLRLALHRGFFPTAPHLVQVAVNVVPVVQHRVVTERTIAEGTGLPGQEVPLESVGLVENDGHGLTVTVGDHRWEPVDDFIGSTPTDRHYVRQPDRLVFGNGVNGKAPPLRARIRHYDHRLTRHEEGNLRAGQRWTISHTGFTGTNPHPMTGGRPATTVDEALAAARTVATARPVVVTDDDLRRAARRLPGFAVARAEVLAGFDASLPPWLDDGKRREVDGVRTLVVVPHRDVSLEPEPVPADYTDAVGRALADRVPLGERLRVRGPRYVPVEVSLTVTLEAGADPEVVRRAVTERIRHRLSDLVRSDDIEPWPLGRPVADHELMALAASADGVLVVTAASVRESGGEFRPCVELPDHGVAVVGSGSIAVQMASPTTAMGDRR